MRIHIFLYSLFTNLYFSFIRIAAYFNSKASSWVKGRQGLFERLEADFRSETRPVFWIHCASLGEFEQGRPIIEIIKKEYPDWKILLTFFSPSGYEICKKYSKADFVYYLPSDSKKNAQKWLEIVKPTIVVFVKYEFWFFHLDALKKAGIPTFLVSAIFRKNQPFFRMGINKLHRHMLLCFNHIFVQNRNSEMLLANIGINNTDVTGDTRVDRVVSIAKLNKKHPIIEGFKGENNLMICGSTWSKDEDIIIPFINHNKEKRWKWIIAPHDIQEAHIQEIIRKLKVAFVRYSALKEKSLKGILEEQKLSDTKVLIIDNIGMLSSLYQYGELAYIGGGFGAGIHNILEPGAFGLPIIFGTNYQKFEEANFLIANGGAFSVGDRAAFETVFNQLKNRDFYSKTSKIVQQYIQMNEGATLRIMEKIRPYFLNNSK